MENRASHSYALSQIALMKINSLVNNAIRIINVKVNTLLILKQEVK